MKKKILVALYNRNGGGGHEVLPQEKAPCLVSVYYKDAKSKFGDRAAIMEIETEMEETEYIKIDRSLNPKKEQQKASALTVGGHGAGNHSDMDLFCVAMRGRNPNNPSDRRYGIELEQRLEVKEYGKTNCLTTVQKDNLIVNCLASRRNEFGKQIRKQYESGRIVEQRKNIQQLEPRFDGKTNTLTTVEKDNLIMEAKLKDRVGGVSVTDRGISFHRVDEKKSGIGELGTAIYPNQKSDTVITAHPGTVLQLNENKEFGHQPRQQNRVYSESACSPALQQGHAGQSPNVFRNCRIRRLTPTECARLQTIPAWYQWKGRFEDGTEKPTSDTQIYRMLGNGWCVEIIKHIFSFLPEGWIHSENQIEG